MYIYQNLNHENNATTSGKFHGYMNTAKVGYKEKIIFEKEVEIYQKLLVDKPLRNLVNVLFA